MKKILKMIATVVIVIATVGCTNPTVSLTIKDQNGDGHYYGRKPVESIEMWCFIHNQYEKIEIK